MLTVLTDSMEMYESRVTELQQEEGDFGPLDAAAAYHRYLLGTTVDWVEEFDHYGRKRIHNLKYYTWVEQQGKSYEEIQAQWYDNDYWTGIQALVDPIDQLIDDFNTLVAS